MNSMVKDMHFNQIMFSAWLITEVIPISCFYFDTNVDRKKLTLHASAPL